MSEAPHPTTLEEIAERLDFMAQAFGILLLVQHGFVLPNPLLGGLVEQLGVNLVPDAPAPGVPVQ